MHIYIRLMLSLNLLKSTEQYKHPQQQYITWWQPG